MTDNEIASQNPGLELRLDTGMAYPVGRAMEIEVIPPRLVYTSISGGQIDVADEAGRNGQMVQLNTRDLLVLQAFLNNAQTMVSVELRRRNGMNDHAAPW